MKFKGVIIASCIIIMLGGCGTLSGIMEQPEEFVAEAQPSVAASQTLLGSVGSPYGLLIATALGYGSALLRRWYKIKQGAKG